MSYIKYQCVPRPIEELDLFLKCHPQVSETQRELIINVAKKGLMIRGGINYPGYEDIVVEFSISPTHHLSPVEIRIPTQESQYCELVAKIFHEAGGAVMIICGAGIDYPIVPTGYFLDEYKNYPLEIKRAIVSEILQKVLFYGPSELAKRIAEFAKKLNYTIYTPNWSRSLTKLGANVVYTRDNTITYEEATQTLVIKLGSPVKDEVIIKMEEYAESADVKFLVAIGISFRPQDRLSEVVKKFIQNKKWILVIEMFDTPFIQEMFKDISMIKIIDPNGALAIFRDEFFAERVISADKEKLIF